MSECNICYEEIKNNNDIIEFNCCNKINKFCYECLKEYLNNLILKTNLNYQKPIYCFCHNNNNYKYMITKSIWYNIIKNKNDNELLNELNIKYIENSSNMLSLQCVGCHTRKTLFISYNEEKYNEYNNNEKYEIIYNDYLNKFNNNIINSNEFLLILNDIFKIDLINNSTIEIYDTIFKPFLSTIYDDQRRAELHLRYLSYNPFVVTECCKKNQCFKCKIGDIHKGKTCEEYQATRTLNQIVNCPECNTALTKGDGCSWITCICQHGFDWLNEIKKIENIQKEEFQKIFPKHTNHISVLLTNGLNLDDIESKYNLYEDGIEEEKNNNNNNNNNNILNELGIEQIKNIASIWEKFNINECKEARSMIWYEENEPYSLEKAYYLKEKYENDDFLNSYYSLNKDKINNLQEKINQLNINTWITLNGGYDNAISRIIDLNITKCLNTLTKEEKKYYDAFYNNNIPLINKILEREKIQIMAKNIKIFLSNDNNMKKYLLNYIKSSTTNGYIRPHLDIIFPDFDHITDYCTEEEYIKIIEYIWFNLFPSNPYLAVLQVLKLTRFESWFESPSCITIIAEKMKELYEKEIEIEVKKDEEQWNNIFYALPDDDIDDPGFLFRIDYDVLQDEIYY